MTYLVSKVHMSHDAMFVLFFSQVTFPRYFPMFQSHFSSRSDSELSGLNLRYVLEQTLSNLWPV